VQTSGAYINSHPTIYTSQTSAQTRAQAVSYHPYALAAKRNTAATQDPKAMYSGGAMKSREPAECIDEPVLCRAPPML